MDLDYKEFEKLSSIDKLCFLEDWIDNPPKLESIPEKNTRQLLRNIIENEEDIYLKKLSIEILSFLSVANVIKKSSVISILLELENENPIVEVIGLKYLYYFYDNNEEVREKYNECINSEHGDICSEAYYRLGLIEFLNNSSFEDKLSYYNCIDKSSNLFKSAFEIAENREDAHYFYEVTNFIKGILSNDSSKCESIYKEIYHISYMRKQFTYNSKHLLLEDKIQSILTNVYRIYRSSDSHEEWIDYQKEFKELAKFYFELLNISLIEEDIQQKLIENFKESISNNILNELFIQNFSFYTKKIENIQSKYHEDTTLNEFLNIILNSIQKVEKKNEVQDKLTICIKIREIVKDVTVDEILKILEDLDDITNVKSILDIVQKYVENKNYKSFDIITGDHAGQEIYFNIKKEIEDKISNYDKDKLNVFLRILEETIRYLVLSIKSKRNDKFSFLYTTDKGGLGNTATERDFQNSLYDHYLYSNIAYGAIEEVNNFADGGRIDIVFNLNEYKFPIELKRTKVNISKESIREKYLEQIQSYVYGYNQLGIFAVLDLNEKISPVNDIRELVYLDNLKPLYELDNKYPDYIVVVIIPGNKPLPSDKSTYS